MYLWVICYRGLTLSLPKSHKCAIVNSTVPDQMMLKRRHLIWDITFCNQWYVRVNSFRKDKVYLIMLVIYFIRIIILKLSQTTLLNLAQKWLKRQIHIGLSKMQGSRHCIWPYQWDFRISPNVMRVN